MKNGYMRFCKRCGKIFLSKTKLGIFCDKCRKPYGVGLLSNECDD